VGVNRFDPWLSVSLSKGQVSHWSTAMYGGGVGSITASKAAYGLNGRAITLTITTPSKDKDTHGGPRRIDIGLSVDEADALIEMLALAITEVSD
jgi:hypothetical protein